MGHRNDLGEGRVEKKRGRREVDDGGGDKLRPFGCGGGGRCLFVAAFSSPSPPPPLQKGSAILKRY